ncbi:gamma-glutamyltransferase [Candidatus Sumerlaeota bacterium]|nr:gamma-glutamyltransferase [Candidatus Sumerlaeota bacterium]
MTTPSTDSAGAFASNSADAALRKLEERGIRADPYRAGRTMTMSRNGIVASSHVYASQAGLDMLRSGGNAMDAAVAAAATLAVVEPMMTGMGGDVFLLYYEAKTGKVYALNGSGHSPRNLTRDYFTQKAARGGREEIDGNSWEAVTVPGAVDAWATALARFGSKPMKEVLAPAIRYAEEGYPVTEIVQEVWAGDAPKLTKDAWTAKTYLIGGHAPKRGEVFKNPNLARSLRLVADGGRDAFYRGPIAEEIVRYARESGGFLTMEDFAAHTSNWVEPISTNYRGYDVYQCPPNGQGLGVLLMLNILEGFDFKGMKLGSPGYLHLLIEAKKLAYADLYKYVADPEKSPVPIKSLLSKEYAAKRRALMDPKHAAPDAAPGLPEGKDTIYLTAIDKDGNAVSFINSLYSAFGSGITGGSTGILLQNRGDGFTLEHGHFNEYAPGKRPYHTIIPGMVLKSGKLYMSYGLMGGPMQPQGHVQFLLSHLDFGLTPQEAADLPRWRHTDGLKVLLEHGASHEAIEGLRAMGHEVHPAAGDDFGGCQAILVDPATGTYFGASDPRKDGAALGY